MVADTIIDEMFAPHEVPLDDALVRIYRQVAEKVLQRLSAAQGSPDREDLAQFLCSEVALEPFDELSRAKYMGDADAILAFMGRRGIAYTARMQEVLDFLNSIEGAGYGGMAAFEIARGYVRDIAMSSTHQSAPDDRVFANGLTMQEYKRIRDEMMADAPVSSTNEKSGA